jgi:DNA-binding NtrC family response regulator
MSHKTRDTLLAVSLDEKDRQTLAQAAKRVGYDLIDAGTIQEAMQFARDSAVRVIVCGRSLPDGDWRDLVNLSALWKSPAKIVVVSRLADHRLWSEVLNLGAYDLLAAPLNERDVSYVLVSACQDSYGAEASRQEESLDVPCL